VLVEELTYSKLLPSLGLQDQHANLVVPANKSMPTHINLLTLVGLLAQCNNGCLFLIVFCLTLAHYLPTGPQGTTMVANHTRKMKLNRVDLEYQNEIGHVF